MTLLMSLLNLAVIIFTKKIFLKKSTDVTLSNTQYVAGQSVNLFLHYHHRYHHHCLFIILVIIITIIIIMSQAEEEVERDGVGDDGW